MDVSRIKKELKSHEGLIPYVNAFVIKMLLSAILSPQALDLK